MLKLVCDDRIPFLKGVWEPFARVEYLPGKAMDAEAVRDADALIIRTRTRCDAALLRGSRVRFIATATIGFDHVVPEDLADLGIRWTNAPGCNAASVAQYFASAVVNSGLSYRGRTLGVIGVGHVGKLVEKAGIALGMQVICNDPPRAEAEGPDGFLPLGELLERSDFVTVHVPLETGGKHPTVGLIGEREFSRMKPGAFFLNSCRGEAVDETALLGAVRDGRIACAGVDVWRGEPDVSRELLNELTFSTPHVAGYSTDGKANGTSMSVRSVARFFGVPELADWLVKDIPVPEGTSIRLDPADTPEAQIRFAVNASYDIRQDTSDLRNAPERFEALRGGYRLRREFPAYRVSGALPEAAQVLHALGFCIAGEGGSR